MRFNFQWPKRLEFIENYPLVKPIFNRWILEKNF